MRRWRTRHPDLCRARNRLYKRRARERRGSEIDAINAAWLAAHPEVKRAKDQGYRARRRAASGAFTGKEWRELVIFYGSVCGYCGEARPLEPDHRIPLSRGGDNGIANIILACHACNGRKGMRTEAEFRQLLAGERGNDGKNR